MFPYTRGLLYFQGSDGQYWSGTIFNGNEGYRIGQTIGALRPQIVNGKCSGLALRCSKKIASWSYLFTQYGYGDNQDGGTGLKSYPLDYVYSGRYYWNTGRLYYQGGDAILWSSTIVSSTNAYRLFTWSTVVRPAESYNKAGGHALRCVSRY